MGGNGFLPRASEKLLPTYSSGIYLTMLAISSTTWPSPSMIFCSVIDCSFVIQGPLNSAIYFAGCLISASELTQYSTTPKLHHSNFSHHAVFRAASFSMGYFSHKPFQYAAIFLLLSLTSCGIIVQGARSGPAVQ